MDESQKGILYPTRLPTFQRLPAPGIVAQWVQWFWIPEWDIDPGKTSRQHILSFPASNLVVQPGGVELVGPTTRVSHRDLTGKGWAVGARLRPAAVPHFTQDPAAIKDTSVHYPASDLYSHVSSAMMKTEPNSRRRNAVEVFTEWLVAQDFKMTADGDLANLMMDFITENAEVQHIDDVASHLAVSSRTLQRVAKKHIGLGLSAIIQRRRLQDAAERSRTEPSANLSVIAAELGYSDQSHLINDFQKTLGFTPGMYRKAIAETE